MKNQEYSIKLDETEINFSVPTKSLKKCIVVNFNNEITKDFYDFTLDVEEIDSLINFLKRSKDFLEQK